MSLARVCCVCVTCVSIACLSLMCVSNVPKSNQIKYQAILTSRQSTLYVLTSDALQELQRICPQVVAKLRTICRPPPPPSTNRTHISPLRRTSRTHMSL